MNGQFKVLGNGIYLKGDNDLFPVIKDDNPKNLELACHVLNWHGRLIGLVKVLKEKSYASMSDKQKAFIDAEIVLAENVPGED